MKTKSIDQQVEEMHKFAEEIRKDPERACKFLYDTGMYTRTGKLKKKFR